MEAIIPIAACGVFLVVIEYIQRLQRRRNPVPPPRPPRSDHVVAQDARFGPSSVIFLRSKERPRSARSRRSRPSPVPEIETLYPKGASHESKEGE